MRVTKYLVDKNIGLGSLNDMCDYLHFEHLGANNKLSDTKISLFDSTLNDQSFHEWLRVKKIEFENARSLVQNLSYKSKTEIDEILGEKILNALSLLIIKLFYSRTKKNLLQIIQSNKTILEKIALLKTSEPFSKPTEASSSSKINKRTSQRSHDSYYDPYENFHWGGLSGEEAYIGYWNTH
jgi:hypothetical protein